MQVENNVERERKSRYFFAGGNVEQKEKAGNNKIAAVSILFLFCSSLKSMNLESLLTDEINYENVANRNSTKDDDERIDIRGE